DRDDRGFFIAMEYVDGWNLRTVLRVLSARQVLMPTEIACRLLSDVCAGLHAAHTVPAADGTRKGVVHRDVSPSNILMSQVGTAKLTDFGIAKAMGSLQVTKPGTMKGKAPYMAPEQIQAKDALIGPATDVFAAGAVLFECITGRRMFRGSTEYETM